MSKLKFGIIFKTEFLE